MPEPPGQPVRRGPQPPQPPQLAPVELGEQPEELGLADRDLGREAAQLCFELVVGEVHGRLGSSVVNPVCPVVSPVVSGVRSDVVSHGGTLTSTLDTTGE